ncbi:ABSCISIC ACID-INSENSITIVE 5-like protein 2 [Prunus yedoensis var. nudiflora]|uniref:ABSCISIC ACID-INSENSITIVE 5-like protein 2 n=1 Tax=Prunus yedoensis var. nudiflora TaxID=2094558 RepID=A0A314Y9W0_PRUYE|nr:ABSCISIC ACID-INSENSITIVE 5-like protein 2 [Prunus yedoensis var. nudiflora]
MKERTIERRQKRMIKNRESAARSRARKQAYTNQLEHEVFQLGKVNSWLKKQKSTNTETHSHHTKPPDEEASQILRSLSALLQAHLFQGFAHVVVSVQMETKRSGGGGEVTVGQVSLLTCAWEALATLLTSALLSLAAQPGGVPTHPVTDDGICHSSIKGCSKKW